MLGIERRRLALAAEEDSFLGCGKATNEGSMMTSDVTRLLQKKIAPSHEVFFSEWIVNTHTRGRTSTAAVGHT